MIKAIFFYAMCQVSLPKIDTSGEYAPLKFSLEHYTCNSNTGRNTGEQELLPSRLQGFVCFSLLYSFSVFLQSVTLLNYTKYFVVFLFDAKRFRKLTHSHALSNQTNCP